MGASALAAIRASRRIGAHIEQGAHVFRVHSAGQQQVGGKHRLSADDCARTAEFHACGMPRMANDCNKSDRLVLCPCYLAASNLLRSPARRGLPAITQEA